MKVQAKGHWPRSEVGKVFKGLNEYTEQETFNSKRQVETGVKYISSIGPLAGAGGVSLPSLSSTEMRSSAEYQRAARVSERETVRSGGG